MSDLDRLIEAVRAIAAERPEHTYEPLTGEPCSYLTSRNEPGHGCLIGQAFERIGVPRDVLRVVENTSAVHAAINLGLTPADDPRMAWLDFLQGAQDDGMPWGDAVADADLRFDPSRKGSS